MILHLLTPNASTERVELGDGRVGYLLVFDDLVQRVTPAGASMIPTGITVKVGPLDAAGLASIAAAYAAQAEAEDGPVVEVPRLVVPGMSRRDRRRR